jgi:hypothetical protein
MPVLRTQQRHSSDTRGALSLSPTFRLQAHAEARGKIFHNEAVRNSEEEIG